MAKETRSLQQVEPAAHELGREPGDDESPRARVRVERELAHLASRGAGAGRRLLSAGAGEGLFDQGGAVVVEDRAQRGGGESEGFEAA